MIGTRQQKHTEQITSMVEQQVRLWYIIVMVEQSLIKLVCFDLGGVVVKTCDSFSAGCKAAGIPVREFNLSNDLLRISHQLQNKYQCGLTDLPSYAKELAALVNELYSPDEIMAVHRAWLLGEYDGVLEVIQRLNARGIETATLSNTCGEHWKSLIEYPSIRIMKHKFASYQFGLSKPQPEIYQAVENETKFSGNEILFFDDLAENISAAQEHGWIGKQINPQKPPSAQLERTLIELNVFSEI